MNPAFAYFYDDFLSSPKYERELSLIENELAVKGISGSISRLTIQRDDRGAIRDRVANGAKNLVFVGNDATVEKMMRMVPEETDVSFGYLPVIENSAIAKLLGMMAGARGVEVLAARLIETIDLGKIGDRHFLTECIVTAPNVELEIDGQYRVSHQTGGAIAVRNLGSPSSTEDFLSDPKDGLLEAVIQAPLPVESKFWKRVEISETRILFKQGKLLSKNAVPVFIDGKEYFGHNLTLGIDPKRLRIISGRTRKLA